MSETFDLWMCKHLQCFPSTHGQLLYVGGTCVMLFAFIAWLRARSSAKSDPIVVLMYILRSGFAGGATFCLSVLLALYPFSGNVRELFSYEILDVALVLGGTSVAALQIYALLWPPRDLTGDHLSSRASQLDNSALDVKL
jgi:hypothetical protein